MLPGMDTTGKITKSNLSNSTDADTENRNRYANKQSVNRRKSSAARQGNKAVSVVSMSSTKFKNSIENMPAIVIDSGAGDHVVLNIAYLSNVEDVALVAVSLANKKTMTASKLASKELK